MAERPILFNDAMVRAILSGAKTQTRRPITKTSRLADGFAMYSSGGVVTEIVNTFEGDVIDAKPITCPFGVPGDRLWVRECFALGRVFDESRAAELPIIESDVPAWYRADGSADESWANRGKWRPSIHMPRWASRISLRVTEVRVERVQDISEEDAKEEGVYPLCGGYCGGDADAEWSTTARKAFADLWGSAYGSESWTANPWVWIVNFERVEVERG